ncbi:MAG: hypothetical protein WC162_02785 [Sphaerochaetaceae bacterium]|nr:hypothetical protein [Sphaerochaetaceae bacterium]
MKKLSMIIIVLILSFSVFSEAPVVSNEILLGITGIMPMTYNFTITQRDSLYIDVVRDSGSQIPIASYVFSSNSIADTHLTVYPKGQTFNIDDLVTGSKYGYEIAVCTYDGSGNVESIMQFDRAKKIDVRALVVGQPEYGEIYACLGYNQFDEIPSGQYSSDLYFEITIP